ncbi:MAG: hypothetical protein ACKVPX_11055 [Myxococcaceae bacterium]
MTEPKSAPGASIPSEFEDMPDPRVERAKRHELLDVLAIVLKRLLALIPPKRTHLTRFCGVFAPNASLRPQVVRSAEAMSPSPAHPAPPPRASALLPKAPRTETAPRRRPRIDWAFLQRHTFAADVFRCPCGGNRTVVALVTRRATVDKVLQNLARNSGPPPLATAHSPPQAQLAF